jgi:hypothetical protein
MRPGGCCYAELMTPSLKECLGEICNSRSSAFTAYVKLFLVSECVKVAMSSSCFCSSRVSLIAPTVVIVGYHCP